MGGRGKREKKAVQKVPVRNLPKIVSKGGTDGETESSKGRWRVRTRLVRVKEEWGVHTTEVEKKPRLFFA